MISKLRFLGPILMLLVVAACSSGSDPTTTSASTSSAPPTTVEIPAETTTTVPPTIEFWLGEIASQMIQVEFETDDAGAITGLITSPTEEIPGLPVTGNVAANTVTINVPSAAAVFEGTIVGDSMSGTWYQSGDEVPVTFERMDTPFVLDRPQEPEPPFPYEATDVRFENEEISLAGTLVIPPGEGPFPAVVFATGSGAQDRDETLVGHKPFLVLADAFARSGIASLRFDDRGIGGSTGNPIGLTTSDLATDTAAAVAFLASDPRVGSVGIVGHSEGGLIGPMVASQITEVEFVNLLAGPGLPGRDVLLRQTEDLMRSEGASEADIAWQMAWRAEVMEAAASDSSDVEVADLIRVIVSDALTDPPADVTNTLDPALTEQFVSAFTDPWMRYFLAYDPAPTLEGLEIPVLALIGSLDLQVSADENIPALDAALAENPDATVSQLDGLNHLFQTAETGALSEYAQIDETFAPAAIELIIEWITERS